MTADLIRRWLPVLLCFLVPALARANPFILNPSSALAFAVVAFMALIVEAGIVSSLLAFAGLNPLRLFLSFWVINTAVFLFLFWPLQSRLPIPALEAAVVLADACGIMLLAQVPAFQGETYSRLRWPVAGIIALLGNASSFFIGIMASGEPWKVHDTGE